MLQVGPVQGQQAAVMAVKADHNHTVVVVEAAAGVVVVLAVLAINKYRAPDKTGY